jgi:peroxiredoxin
MKTLLPMENDPPVSRRPKTAVIIISVVVVACLLLGMCVTVLGLGWLVVRSGQGVQPSQPPVEQGERGSRTGEKALDFNLTDLTGKVVSLSDYEGKAVLLNFWATWCGYCIDEFPTIQEYQDLYPGSLVVLAVEQGSPLNDITEFVAFNHYSFIFLSDEDYKVGDAYGVMAIPASYFIDQSGVIRMIYEGLMEKINIEAGLRAVGLQ